MRDRGGKVVMLDVIKLAPSNQKFCLPPWSRYRMTWKVFRYLGNTFWRGSHVWQTDRQMDGRTFCMSRLHLRGQKSQSNERISVSRLNTHYYRVQSDYARKASEICLQANEKTISAWVASGYNLCILWRRNDSDRRFRGKWGMCTASAAVNGWRRP